MKLACADERSGFDSVSTASKSAARMSLRISWLKTEKGRGREKEKEGRERRRDSRSSDWSVKIISSSFMLGERAQVELIPGSNPAPSNV